VPRCYHFVRVGWPDHVDAGDGAQVCDFNQLVGWSVVDERQDGGKVHERGKTQGRPQAEKTRYMEP